MIERCKTGKDARLGKMQDWKRNKTGKYPDDGTTRTMFVVTEGGTSN
jgi:hypothetical protein